MTVNKNNLRDGLDTFTQPAKPRYVEALKLYDEEVKRRTKPWDAIDTALDAALKGLPDQVNKRKNARIAAKVTLDQRSQDPFEPRDWPTWNFFSSISGFMEKKAVKKVRASKQPPLRKARKAPIFWGVIAGILAAGVITLAVQIYAAIQTGDPRTPWAPGFLIFFLVAPFTVAYCTSTGYQMALRRRSTEDSEDATPALSSNTHTAQEVT